jgi:outer membrane protein assembly factor BamA
MARGYQSSAQIAHRTGTDTIFTEKPHRKVDTTKMVEQKDLYEVVGGLFKKKNPSDKKTKKDTITSKPTFSVIPAAGYTLVSRLVATLSGNMAFRTDSTARISSVTAYVSYTENKQFLFPVESDIWTRNNDYELVGDFRFYKYPQSTFGLGSSSNIKNEDPMDYFYVSISEKVLRKITENFFAGGGYILDMHTDITHQGPLDGAPSDYTAYGPESRTVASGLTANTTYDSRDNSIYPEKGFYAAAEYRDNFITLGSTSAWSSLIVDVRKYFRIPEDSENVLAFWSYDWLILHGHPGYLDLPSTQWDEYSSTGRGYIQGRFRGAQMVYAETEYRFKVTDNGLIGGVVFLNAQSFSGAPDTRLQTIQPGFGPGLRIKLNKVSKTNIAIDYGFGMQGSRGLFVNVGELF